MRRVDDKPIGQEAHHNQVHVKASIMDSNSLLLILKWTFRGRRCRALCAMTLGSVALWWVREEDGGVGIYRTSTLTHTHLYPLHQAILFELTFYLH